MSAKGAEMKAEHKGQRKAHVAEEPPPVGGSWKTLYAVVLLNLAMLVVVFYLFTRAFR
ncbi:MAG: hypothetical protein QOJ70_1344 [Acidobacteriota bacterium]|nr:hypothetical protein [Acidobacteriota bacterium]MDT7807531.1 hypothetical protein [Acidobacteriota bacterium]